jgi:sigma-B regulation protein RsbU (phosphoserine phosphatase)
VVASIYGDELRRPARDLLLKQVIIISLLSALAIVGAIGIVNRFIRPVELLATYARDLPARDFTGATEEIPAIVALAVRPDELGKLAASFRFMEQSLHDYLARLTVATAARERIESELGIAHDIQMGLLRHTFPPFPERQEFDLLAVIKPAREVGGDFYDFFMTGDNRLFFVIADVAGKGIPASLYMAMTMTLIKAIARSGVPPDEILNRLNTELSRDNETCMFVTVFCGILDVSTGEVLFANGGHNPPLLVNREGGAEFLSTAKKLPPGAMEGVGYRRERVILKPGDRLLLYTDGVTEAANCDDELFSAGRLRDLVAQSEGIGLQELPGEIMAAIEAHAGGADQADDITILAIEYSGGIEVS